jgi:hypothetical protein
MDGGFATFNAPARIGVLVREMRGAVDRLLERHIDQPTEHDGKYFPLTAFLRLVAHTRLTFIFTISGANSLSDSPVVKAVLELLATEGF